MVENYHTFARGYLNSRGQMPYRNGIACPDEKASYIEQAVDYFKKKYPAETTFKYSIDFFIEEITFIERFGLSGFAEYKEAERIGRASANIKRENRKWIFEVYEKYRELRKADGKKYDWDDLALYVFNELQNDDSERRCCTTNLWQSPVMTKESKKFVLNLVEISELLGSPEFKTNITIGKVLKIIEDLIDDKETSKNLSKKYKVDQLFVEQIGKYVTDMKYHNGL